MKKIPPSPHSALVGSLSLTALLLAFSAPAQAIALISNLDGNDGIQTLNLSSVTLKALAFTLPSGADYTLDNVVLRLRQYSTSDFVLTIRDDGGANPGTNTLVQFTAPQGLGDAIQNYTFNPVSTFTLIASTKYWLVAAGTSSVPATADWMASNPSVSFTGTASLTGNRFSNTGGTSYSDSSIINSFAVNATPNATPVPLESDALPVVGSALFMAGGLWWKKKHAQAKVTDFMEKE